MKPLSNTSIAAIFAVGLTGLVALMLQTSFFKDKETQTTDEMLLWRYQLHNKYFPIKPDPHIVVAAIDLRSLQDLQQRWPFSRNVHGDFLILLNQLKPRAVGWDVFFTERESTDTSTSAAPAQPPTDASTAPANSTPTANPAATTSTPPAASPTPQASTPAPATSPSSPAPQPATPAPAGTNSTPPPTPPATAPTTDVSNPDSLPIGAEPSSGGTNSAPPASTTTPAAAPSSDASNPNPAPSPSTPTPPPAAAPALSPAASSATPDASSTLDADDQHFVDAATLFPNMVTAAEQRLRDVSSTGQVDDSQVPPTDADFLPTRPFQHVNGDITKLLTSPLATMPFPELRKETYFGFANENGESGGGSRRYDPLVVNIAGRVLPSFDLQLLMQYWGVDPDQVIVNLGQDVIVPRPDGTQAHIPIDEKGQMTLNYRAQLEDFKVKGYAEISAGLYAMSAGQKSLARDSLPPLKDNLLVIGVTVNGIDTGPTPLNTNTPLVVTHLNALNNILQQDFLIPVPDWGWIPIYALFLFGTGSLMLRVGIAPMIPMGILAVVLLAGVGFVAMWFNYSIPVATPELGILLLAGAVPTKRFFGEEREKLRVKNAMRSYLSDKVMNKILAHPDGVKLGGVKQVITIMFCDIRGFTAYCDNRDPQEVLNVVNEYFEEMTQVVFKYEGTVDKYIGDCIMAFWNAPDDQPDHAQRAVCCAMEMRYALANFKVKRAGLDTELFECGIGIHTGEALVGNMGSTLKVNYTAMGSTVNLGARLESLTKKLNERILISHATLEQLTGDFPITDRGEAIIPGFADPIHVYGVGAEQDLGSAIQVGLKLAKKQEYTADEVTKPIWAPAPLPEDADPNP